MAGKGIGELGICGEGFVDHVSDYDAAASRVRDLPATMANPAGPTGYVRLSCATRPNRRGLPLRRWL